MFEHDTPLDRTTEGAAQALVQSHCISLRQTLGNPEPGLDSQQAQGTLKMSLQGRPENNTINITASPDGPRCTLQHHGLHTHNTHWDLCVRTQGVYLHRARTRRQRASKQQQGLQLRVSACQSAMVSPADSDSGRSRPDASPVQSHDLPALFTHVHKLAR